jgi:hypothetical protein
MHRLLGCAALAALLGSATAQAADVGIYGTAGTIGLGGGIAANFNDHLGARLGYTTYEYDVDDVEKSDLTFNGTADLGGAHALLDWYPFGGGFRISAGMMENAEVRARAVPVGNTFTFDGVTYSTEDVGHATGTAEFDSTSPYVGLGFGRALSRDGRFALTLDLGVAFTGTPDVKLDVTCAADFQAVCTQLAADVAGEEAELEEEAEDYKYWPVLNLGLSFRV